MLYNLYIFLLFECTVSKKFEFEYTGINVHTLLKKEY